MSCTTKQAHSKINADLGKIHRKILLNILDNKSKQAHIDKITFIKHNQRRAITSCVELDENALDE